jgi:hypothetical protein
VVKSWREFAAEFGELPLRLRLVRQPWWIVSRFRTPLEEASAYVRLHLGNPRSPVSSLALEIARHGR